MTKPEKVHGTQPVNHAERLMQERFSEAIADQSRLMDRLAQQLLVLELAIPGLYATILKLVSSHEQSTLSPATCVAFGFWLLALVLTLLALLPRKYRDVVRSSPDSIEAFFDRAARYKRRLLLAAILSFVAGILSIIMDILQ